MDKSIIRTLSKNMKPYIDKYVGKYYTIFHIFVSLITILMLLFNNDIVFLAITLTIFTAELFINISYNDSPLTLMEEKIEKRCHKKNKKNKNNKNNNKNKKLKYFKSKIIKL